MNMTDRIPTGIPGLDELIQGGFVKGSVTLLSGGAGCGKTLMSSQYLWNGLQDGKNCLFVTLEEDPDEIKKDALEFNWDFEQYEDAEQFKIIYLNPFKNSGGFADRIRSELEHIEADRVVIDSTSVMGMYDENPGRIRERLYTIIRMLRRNDVTAVITSEIPRGEDEKVSRYGVEEFVADGVIVLRGIGMAGEMGRRLIIEKMRRTDFQEDIYPIKFTDDGLKVEEPEEGISL